MELSRDRSGERRSGNGNANGATSGVGRIQALLGELHRSCSRPWTLMEVCGGQTHAILRHGLDQLLPPQLTLIHGPGCPVCVTDSGRIEQALTLAGRPEVILCSFGDMLRVPGSSGRDLLEQRGAGGDVRVVYSPLDVLAIARSNPERRVVFFAVGFETTAPATALLAERALAEGLANLELLVAHVRVPPVLEVMLADPECRVQAILAAGHVCTVMGEEEYGAIASRHRRPIVVTGFEPEELLRGMLAAVRQLERGEHRVENAYARAARAQGNAGARDLLERVFLPVDREWRGLGTIPAGGLELKPPYDTLASRVEITADDAGPVLSNANGREGPTHAPAPACISGLVLQGLKKPQACPSFGTTCTPERPLGAPMVSGEGACAAYYRYQR